MCCIPYRTTHTIPVMNNKLHCVQRKPGILFSKAIPRQTERLLITLGATLIFLPVNALLNMKKTFSCLLFPERNLLRH